MQGDRDAFGALFQRHYALLYQFGYKICPEPATLEDTIQELFVEIWQKKNSPELQSVKAYLLQALKYKLYKLFRNKNLTVSMPEGEGNFELSHDTFIISREQDAERLKKIIEGLNDLPTRQKEIIYLKIYKGLSYEEISEVMGINYQVVRNLLCQALKNFRKKINP